MMFFLKIIQIIKPILILIFLRWVGFDIALEYVFLSSVYVVYLEIVNIFSPTDRLYLKSATAKDMLVKVRYRNFINIALLPLLVIYLNNNVSLLFLVLFVVLILMSAEVNCYYSYFLNKNKTSFLSSKIKSLYEFLVWVVYICLLYFVYVGYINVEFFVVFFILESIVSKWVLIGRFRLRLGLFSGFMYYVRNRKKIFGDICFSGFLFTWVNYFYRIPFVLGLNIEPLYVIGAQVVSVLYNLQLTFEDRLSRYSLLIFNNAHYLLYFLFVFSAIEYNYFESLLLSFTLLCAGHGVLVYILLTNYTNNNKKIFYWFAVLSVLTAVLGSTIHPLIFVVNSFLLLFALKYCFRNSVK